MRHLKSVWKLGRTASHRDAMLANLATSLLDKERVTTTLIKAKAVRSTVERLISQARKKSLHSIRLVGETIRDKDILKKLFDQIGPRFEKREGGYTRIIKVGERKGDNALMAIIELVGKEGEESARPRKKKKSVKPTVSQAAAATSSVTHPVASGEIAPENSQESSAPAIDESSKPA